MNRRVLLELRESINREEKLLSGYREEVKGIKGGQLVIRRKGDRLVFSEKAKGVETGITTDSRKVRNLARKRYLRGEIRYADKICDILKDALHKIEGVPYARASSNMKEISGYRSSASVTRWLDDAGDKNPMAPENLKYKTKSGIAVRSKSERTIADKLSQYDLPYKYDTRLQLGNRVVYPDFIIRRWDDKQVIWEHFGLMTDEEYAAHAIQKMMLYQRCGYITHTDLIYTFERDVEDPAVLDNIIKKFLL